MADNVDVTPGAGATIAADLISGALHQRVKLSLGADGTGVDAPGEGTYGLDVDVTRLPAAPANSGVDIGDVDVTSIVMPTGANAAQVQGTVAHDSAAANNPVLLGGTATNAAQAAVANADVVKLVADLNGRLIVAPYTVPEKGEWYASAADITDTADDEVFAAVANISHFITQFTATNSHATVGTYVVLKDNDTVMFVGYCAPAGGGFAVSFPVPLKAANGVHVNVANVTTGSATRVSVSGFQAP